MSEVYLPSLPEFEVTEVEQCFDLNQATFVLKHGVLQVLGYVSASVKVESFDCVANGDVENSIECDFKYLVVGDVPFDFDQTDIDLKEGQQLKLTEAQRNDLNEILKDMMERD